MENINPENIDNLLISVQTTDWNKERLETLKKLFPDLFTSEGKLNADELKKLIDPKSINETERYEFRWFSKSQAKRNAFTPSNATLVYDEKRSVNPNQTQNLIIEGENLEVLKLLSEAYREKIKCIYIDPPYNTGKDFVYSDNFSQNKKAYWEDAGITQDGIKIDTNTETDGRYHSNWLNMMYSRLLMARALLKPDGVIFISIDDNEVHNLRKLCDEVFGEDNFAGQIVWQTATDNNPTQIATEHEYVICYLKDKNLQDFWEIPSEKGKIIQAKYQELKTQYENNIEEIQIQLRKWIKKQTNGDDLSGISHYSYIDEFGVFYPGNSANTKPGGYTYDIIHPITKNVCAKPNFGYRWPENTFWEANKRGDVLWGNDEQTIPKIKKRLDTANQKLKSYYYEDNRATSLELKNLFDGKVVFNNPKSVNFLKMAFRFITVENDIILDFFGGSGTTGQAVMELNREENINRKFILVQIPEATDPKSEVYGAGFKKISDITIERNKRVIERIKSELRLQELKDEQDLFKNEAARKPLNQGSDNFGFKVFKLTKSKFPRVEWTPEADKTDAENIEALKKYIIEKEAQLVTLFNREELTTEILLKKGFNLNYTTQKQEQFKDNEVYLASDGHKETLICLDAPLSIDTVEYLKTNTDKVFICLERALDTTKKWNLKQYLGDNLHAF